MKENQRTRTMGRKVERDSHLWDWESTHREMQSLWEEEKLLLEGLKLRGHVQLKMNNLGVV